MGKKNPKYELQKREHRHKEKMALLNVLASDPEMKYFMGALLGSASATVLAFSTGKVEPQTESPADTPSIWEVYKKGILAASPVGMLYDEATGGSVSGIDVGQPGVGGMFGFVPGILSLGAAGFGGFCMSKLLLNSIFGDTDKAIKMMSATAEMLDASVPLT